MTRSGILLKNMFVDQTVEKEIRVLEVVEGIISNTQNEPALAKCCPKLYV